MSTLKAGINLDLHSKIAVLVFCTSSHMEAQNKPIFGAEHMDINRKLWSSLKKHSLRCVQLSKLNHFIAEKQSGVNFGQRLSQAISDVFKKGYEQLMVLSIDNPNLSVETILDIAHTLQEKDWVIEPSDRGGINIIGLHKSNFDKEDFALLPWQQDNLTDVFIGKCRKAQHNISILKSNPDFNQLSDLKRWLDASPKSLLSLVIRGFLYKESFKISSDNTLKSLGKKIAH